MKNTYCVGIVILLATMAVAEDIKTTDGTLYKNITIIRNNDAYITVSYDDGIVKIPLADMTEELRNKYKYDPDKANKQIAEDEILKIRETEIFELKKDMDKFLLEWEEVAGEIARVFPDGIVVRLGGGKLVFILGSFNKAEGDVVYVKAWQSGRYQNGSMVLTRYIANPEAAFKFYRMQKENKQ